jgi:hypothetical protein
MWKHNQMTNNDHHRNTPLFHIAKRLTGNGCGGGKLISELEIN